MAQLITKVKCNKTLHDRDGQVFTKGKEYQGNICNILENLTVTNDLGQPHKLGNWYTHFTKIKTWY